MAAQPAGIGRLTEATIDDLADGFHLPRDTPWVRRLMRPLARRFARRIAAFDDRAASRGLPVAARTVLPIFARSLATQGRDSVPRTGPVLAAANHPGVADALALTIALEARPDLKIIALDRPFLRALPGVASRLIWVDPAHPAATVRPAREHLRAGGALLTFPAGTIEPDPLVADDAAAALQRWSRSVSSLSRGIPRVMVVPLAVGGVLSARALNTRFVRNAPTRADREWRAATLQVMVRRYHDTDVRIVVGEPFPSGPAMHDELIVRMAELFDRLAPGSRPPDR